MAAVICVGPIAAGAAHPARAATAAFATNPASLVNPMIGAGPTLAGGAGSSFNNYSGGNTFPGPDMPFGMMQWGPETWPRRESGGGYWYDSSELTGFGLDRLSGAGCPAYGDVPILPMVGAIPADPTNAAVNFSHASETAQPGYYQVTTTSAGTASPVTTRLTTAMRSGIAQFTFPASDQSDLLLKVADSQEKLTSVRGQITSAYDKVFGTTAQVVGDDEVTGTVATGHFCDINDDNHANSTLHFDIRFSQPFTASGMWPGGPGGGPGGVYLTFDTTQDPTVTAKVGISYTSTANAALNLATEIPGWDFAAVRSANVAAWNAMLSRIQVAGGTADEQAEFYTALYHSLLDPRVYSDVNGQYMGMDGKVHTVSPGHAHYADYSGWDIYRDEVPLLGLLAPGRTSDIISSMLADYVQDGMLPKWAQGNAETYELVGDPADPIIAGAYAFGARGFDTRQALQDMTAEATQPNNIRPGLNYDQSLGYLPSDGTYGCCDSTNETGGYGVKSAVVSAQLEYDTADYAIAAFAKALQQQPVYTRFAARAQTWENVFNPATGYVQAKQADGQWAPGFTPSTHTGFAEGSAAQYTPMIPFNLRALIAARGGPTAWQNYLDSLLSTLIMPGSTNANLGDEPSLEIPWEYDYADAPWKTQQAVRQVQTQLYADAPAGLPGNDDLGAMSSWYVWSALGLYPATPGTSTLVTGSPLFPQAVVHLANGKTLAINAPDAATDVPYVHGLQLNGQDWPKAYLAGNQYRNGATLTFDLGPTPDTSWGSAPEDAPPSDGSGEAPAIPYLPDSQVTVSAGQSATITLAARNITGKPVHATATAAPPAGITISPRPATIPLTAGGQGQAALTVTAAADTAPGSYSVPITLSAVGYTGHITTTLAVSVSPPG